MSMRKISLGRYISLLLFFSLLLTPVRTWGVGWTPSDGGLLVNMDQGERFLLSVEIGGKEYFVSNYNRYERPDDIFNYTAGSYLKLLPQAADATEPSEMSIWTVGAPLTRVDAGNVAQGGKNQNYDLGAPEGTLFTIWNDGKTLKTNNTRYQFYGDLTDNYDDSYACDVVFVIPTNRGTPVVIGRTGLSSFDPNNTLGRGTAPFDGATGYNTQFGLYYREVYMLEIPRFNNPVSYTNAALVTFNTTQSTKSWSAGSITKGHAAYAYADSKHDKTTRTIFRLYMLDDPINSCPNSFFFAYDRQEVKRYRTGPKNNACPSCDWTDSTAAKKIYSKDRLFCMERDGATKYYQTDYMYVPVPDSTYFYVGYNNHYYAHVNSSSPKMSEPGAYSQFTKIRQLPLLNLPGFYAPAGAYGRMVADTTSEVDNLNVKFDPAGYFLQVTTPAGFTNVPMKQTGENEWTCEEMWTILPKWAAYTIKATTSTGPTFSATDPGADIDGWSVNVVGTDVPVHGSSETVINKSGWARIYTNRTDENGAIEFILAEENMYIRYHNNGHYGVDVPDQHAVKGDSIVTVQDAQLIAGYNFTGWTTNPDGSGTTYLPKETVDFRSVPEVDGKRILDLYAQATYTGTINVAISFVKADGKRYFLTHPQLLSPRFARARTFSDWTEVRQGMRNAENNDPNYISSWNILGKEGVCAKCGDGEYVLDPRHEVMHGSVDSLVFYEDYSPNTEEYLGLYYSTPNTVIANSTWAGLFTSSAGWPTPATPCIEHTYLTSTHYLGRDGKGEIQRYERSNSDKPTIVYNATDNQFDGTDGTGTDFMISGVGVVDEHYIILPDTSHVWRDTIEFGYHKNERTTEDVWSALIGKQLLAQMKVGNDTIYFHANRAKTIDDPNNLYLSPDFRVTQLFDFIPDSRVATTIEEGDSVTHATTSHYWHHTITSGNSSPINIQDGEGRYIDVIDTFRINLSHGGISKIKEYRGRWKKGAVGLTVSEDGSSRTRDIIVRTKTYHYDDESIRLELTPELSSYTFTPLAGNTRQINFTLTKVRTRKLLDIHGNAIGEEEVVRIDTINDQLALAPGHCTFASTKNSPGTYFQVTDAVSQRVMVATKEQNQADDNLDTLIVSLSIMIGDVTYPVTARVPLTQTSLQGDELIWSVAAGNQRYYIMAGTGGLIFRKYNKNGSSLYKEGTNNVPLIKGSLDAANSDKQYITPWRFNYKPSDPTQLALKVEYGIDRHFKIDGSTPGISSSASSFLTFHYVNIYTNDNANQEEQVKLQYGADKWLAFTLTGGGGAELILVDKEEDASIFSWSYLVREYSLLNNGDYPSRDAVTFGYNTDMSVGIETRYKAYKEYSMLVNNQMTYLCRENETNMTNLTNGGGEWLTSLASSIITDKRDFDGSPDPVSGVSATLNVANATTTVSTTGAATSPRDVKIDGKYVNIVDTLHVTLSLQGGAPAYRFKDKWSSFKSVRDAELKIPLIRKTYHEADYDSLVCTVAGEEYNHTFPNKITTPVSYSFNLGTKLRKGEHVLDVDNHPVAVIDPTETDVTAKMALNNPSYAEIQLIDEYGDTPDWCEITGKGLHSVTVACTESGIRSPRAAYLYIAYIVMIDHDGDAGTPDVMRFVNARLTVSQPSLYEYANNQHLVHSSGASGDPIGEDGMQQVHQNKRILYYYPHQNVELPVRESHFFGWWRWFREGAGEIGNSDIPDSIWRTKPLNTAGKFNYPFRIIGDSVDDGPGRKKLVTMGRYTVFHYKASEYPDVRNTPPIKTALVAPPITTFGVAEKDKPTVTYAVDISNYYDHLPMSLKYKNQIDTAYLDTMRAIPEPTLSLREVFELHPWTEMADTLDHYKTRIPDGAGAHTTKVFPLAGEHYMEDHIVMAPLKNPLLLSTEQRYNYENLTAKGHSESLLGYYMRDDHWSDGGWDAARKDSMIWCGGWDANCEWYTYDPTTQKYSPCTHPITEGDDFLQVPAKQNIPAGKEFDTVYYCLRSQSKSTTTAGTVGSPDPEEPNDGKFMFNICRYMVIYHDKSKYGPMLETNGKALINNDEIEQRYEVLERLNFDYNKPGPDYTLYPHPLPWADASYGYTYPETPDLPHNRLHSQSDLPNFGEYGLVNRIHYTDYWYDMEQHGGAANGYMIYCDGMSSSGQVAALNLNTTLCAGQKMFFSGYIGNPSKNFDKKYARPNFTFSVQGSVNGTDWEDITTYMTGDIEPKNGWYQIYFPIVFNTHVEYHHFRVRIYNMASSWDGNDFIIDDMCIFATKPPLIAYQANTACKEKEDVETPTHVILRVDYQGITGEGYNNKSVFYTVKCVNQAGEPSFVGMIDGYLEGDTIAHKPETSDPDTIYGKLYIPALEYEPEDKDSIFVNMNELIDTFNVSRGVFKEGYIYEILEGNIRPVKYVVHSAYLNPKDTFTVHMSAEYKDMMNSMCGMTSYLKVSNMMVLELNGEEVPDMEKTDLCANATYDIGLRVKGSLYLDSVAPINLNGSCINDWLLYGDTAEATSVTTYGYKYSDIVKVIKDILRCDPKGTKNANHFAPALSAVSKNEMIRIQSEEHVELSNPGLDPYTILADLVNNGFLTLYQPTMTATVYAGDSIQYVIFPILGTGTDTKQHSSVEVCPLPILIKLKPEPGSEKTPLIVGGLNRDPSEMNQPVIVLADVTHSNQEITLKVDSIMELVGIKSVALRSTDDPNFRAGVHSLSFTPDKSYPSSSYYIKGDYITLRPASSNNYQMKPGYSYTYDIVMQTWAGKDTLDGGCPVGTIPFTVSVVPNYLRWDPQGETSSQWNQPVNWIGIDEHNQPIHVNARFAPLNTTSILIPAMTDGRPYPELPNLSNKASYDSVKQVGFQYNTCDYIRFLPGAAISQQQRMEYGQAIVDMPMPQGEWAFRSAPVKGLLSGDLYMSNADMNNETPLWEVGSFDAHGRNDTYGTASFWLSLYGITTVRLGNSAEGIENETQTTDGSWSKVANGLTLSLPPAQGWAVYGRSASGSPAAVRLPKEDDLYYYFNKYGERLDGQYEQNLQALRETNAEAQGGHAGELAFYPSGASESYTIRQDASSQKFVFGNPTMGYIDIWGFIADNGLVNEFGYMAANNKYTTVSKSRADATEDVITEQQRYLPPMHAILVTTTAAASTSLTVRLDTNRVIVSPSKKVRPVPNPAPAPRRAHGTVRNKGIMTVTATNSVSPRCFSQLLIGQGYHDAVYKGEDALLMTLSIDKYTNNTTPATPFNLYAAEGEYGLCIDLRDSIVNIPLSFYMSKLPFDPVTRLWFTGVNKIDEDLVLYDAVTETEQTIADGIYIDIQTPEQSHEVRYYIRRRGFTPQSGTDEPIVTGFEWIETEGNKAVKFIKDDHVYILVNGQVYTILGQKIK